MHITCHTLYCTSKLHTIHYTADSTKQLRPCSRNVTIRLLEHLGQVSSLHLWQVPILHLEQVYSLNLKQISSLHWGQDTRSGDLRLETCGLSIGVMVGPVPVVREVSMLLWPDTTFIRKGSAFPIIAGYNFFRRKVSFLTKLDSTFIWMGSALL